MIPESDRRELAREVVQVWGDSEERAETVRETAAAVGEYFLSAREGIAREILAELDARGVSIPSALVAEVERARQEVRAIDDLLRRQACSIAASLRSRLWAIDDVLRRVGDAAVRATSEGAVAPVLVGLSGGLLPLIAALFSGPLG